jgi:periplasmic divalent cation tolerance protein
MTPCPGVAMTVLLVYSAFPTQESALRVADTLIEERLAACVNVLPGMTSVYRWQGAIERANEALLLAKTHPVKRDALQARIVALHPYELPEVVAVDAGTLPACLDWITRETNAPPAP